MKRGKRVQLYNNFNQGEGEKFIDQVRSEPTLADALVASKFPDLAAKVEIKPWKELLFLPQDLFFRDFAKQVQVLASR